MVDGKTDQKEVLNIFKNKYRAILYDPLSQTRPKKYDNILEKINNETHINNCRLYSKDINYAINKLKAGTGFDLVHSQHLENVNNAYKEFIARLFSTFISHNYLPEKMLHWEIRSLIKNKFNNKW